MKLYRSVLFLFIALFCGGCFFGCTEEDTLDGAKEVHIRLNPSEITLRVGDTICISAEVTNSKGKRIETPIAWSIDDESVATLLGDYAVVAVKGAHGRTTQLRATLPNGMYAYTFITVEKSSGGSGGGTGGNNGSGTISGSDFDIFANLSYDDMVYVEGGTYLMGAQSTSPSQPNYDFEAYDRESPVHQVTLSSYYIGKYQVTQQLWEYVMNYSGPAADGSTMSAYGSDPWLGTNPSSSYGLGNNYPAYYVSYNDIVNYFIPRLNQITGKNFRLPTEAEWEYAARGGQKDEYTRTRGAGTYYKYSGSNTIGNVAWYSDNSSSTSHPVGTKQANALGLYDMSGNLWEWCSDWYDSSYYSNSATTNPTGPTSGSGRVLRGGYWGNDAVLCRVSSRHGFTPSLRGLNFGFRLSHD